MVDLLVPYAVTVVQLAFAEECPSEVEVFVDDKRCSGNTSCSQALMTLDCGGVVGWNVTVFHPDVPPSLCEVEVFSTWEHPDNLFPQRPPSRDHCSLELCSRNYVFVDKGPTTWAGAQTLCRQRSMDLAAIHSAQDMNAVVDAMQEKPPQDFWIGLYHDQPSWRWSLSDGGHRGDATDPFRNWAPGEPGEQPGQHCAGMQDTGEWRDLDCGSLNFYVCVDGREGASQTKILVKRPTTWADAQQNCRKSYSDLVRVRDPAENEEIRKTVPAGKLVWIGLYGDSWKWSDGGDAMFRYWRPGQADGSGEGAKCAQVSGGAWRVESCDAKSMVLCYYYKKRTLVKISAGIDMCDPAIQQQIQKQLEGKLLKMGNNNFKVHWRRTTRLLPDKNEEARCEPAKEV